MCRATSSTRGGGRDSSLCHRPPCVDGRASQELLLSRVSRATILLHHRRHTGEQEEKGSEQLD